jgi:hypothetical protein
MRHALAIVLAMAAAVALVAWPAAPREEIDNAQGTRAMEPLAEAPRLLGLPPARATTAQRDAASADDARLLRPIPEEPVERGTSRLILRFTREGDERPVTPRVTLWRLGAPGNTEWTAGDQQHDGGAWRDGALVYEGLPNGRYRAQTLGTRAGCEDPPAFEVAGRQTEVRLVVPMPAMHDVRLVVLDEHGVARTTGRRLRDGVERRTYDELPPWRHARAVLDDGLGLYAPRGHRVIRCICPGVGGMEPNGGAPLTGDRRGFVLGEFAEAPRGVRATHYLRYGDTNRSEIDVTVRDDEAGEPGDRTYVGVSAPLPLLASRVVLPDGRLALDAGAAVSARSKAVRKAADTPSDAWRRIPIHVEVTLTGYERLHFEIDLDGRMARWTMKPAATN